MKASRAPSTDSLRATLADLVASFHGRRALIVGDAIIDEYVFGHCDRLSPEAPVPVFVSERVERRRGGADHVSHQLEQFGIQTNHYFAPTPSLKQRFIAGHHQVFRIDRDSAMRPGLQDRQTALGMLDGMDVLVLSDYAKGWLTAELAGCLIGAASELKIPVVVDPKVASWARYAGATVFCPNHIEWERHSCDFIPAFVWIKRGPAGIEVIERGKSVGVVPANVRSVIDVTGAGDVVTAVAAACAAVRAGSLDGARLANLAAGESVGQIGTAVCSKARLLELVGEAR